MSEIASVVDADQQMHENQSDALAWSQVIVSLFTPSWSLGLLLAVCLFLTHTLLLDIALLTEPAGTESETAWTWLSSAMGQKWLATAGCRLGR